MDSLTLGRQSAEWMKREVDNLAAAAFQSQGWRAFETPKSAAVVHEAGHAVLYAYFGATMRFVKVWQCTEGIERGQWKGWAEAIGHNWPTGPDTPPEQDFKNACLQMSGWAAEALFDAENMRAASSLDEVAFARALASNIARKTDQAPPVVMSMIMTATFSILTSNEDVVREVARLLDRRQIVRSKRLAVILARVERPS